jgi:hypothetical protein
MFASSFQIRAGYVGGSEVTGRFSLLPVETALRISTGAAAWETGQADEVDAGYNADLFYAGDDRVCSNSSRPLLSIVVQQPEASLSTIVRG